jgi:hypothetical protein
VRALSSVDVHLDLVRTTAETAEVAKFATKYGYRLQLGPSQDGAAPANSWTARLHRDEPDFLHSDLVRLVYVEALARGSTIDQVLDRVRRELAEQWHVATDRPLADRPGIGEGSAT